MNARLIDHQQAVNSMMAERYLLGELNEGERNAFEEHFFECSDCFEQVKAGTEFISSLKKVGTEETAAVPSGWRPAMGQWFRPKSAQILGLMFLGLASFSIYQGILIRQAGAPELVSVQTLHPDARDGSGTAVKASRRGVFELRVVFEADAASSSGRIQITDETGREVTSVPVNDLRGPELYIRFNTGKFHTGKYLLTLKAIDQASGSEKVLNQYPFALTIKD
jgi:anti-sigma factor RsiW